MNRIKFLANPSVAQSQVTTDFANLDQVGQVRKFHSTFPDYKPTPLVSLDHLSQALGVKGIYIKDESCRFGLGAFKALGGTYAMGRLLADRMGEVPEKLSYQMLTDPKNIARLGEITFVTATDGNHGRGVAWTAAQLGQKAVVYMPKGSAPARLAHIQSLGAQASITDLSYDDAVRLAAAQAQERGWILVQDTAWEGYEEIPLLIMQGYTTMALEAWEQLEQRQEKPTHIFIQAGVGSLAAAVVAFFVNAYPKERPRLVIVEPETVDCIFRTAQAGDGKLHPVTGAYHSIMAGLSCGEPSTLAWPVLGDYAYGYLSCSDSIAAKGMRILGAPLPGDSRVISGESGAVGLGAAVEILQRPQYAQIRKQLGLDENSRILCFSTEGDTDPLGYREIVWDGAYSSQE